MSVVTCVGLAYLLAPHPTAAQQDSTPGIRPPRPGAQFTIPLASMILPGIGQFVYGRPLHGAAFLGTTAAGVGIALSGDPEALELESLPRTGDTQRAFYGLQLASTAGMLSAYETFRTGLPALRANGEYQFIGDDHASTLSLFTAPFDPTFLTRWTTWLGLAYTGAVAALVAIEGTDPGQINRPFTVGDGAFTAGVSLNAGIGEEALFRGWLYPLLYENLGAKWLANPIQAGIFGALHPQAGPFAIMIGGWALYQGWLTKRNGWNVRESIFQHVWYDVVIIAATLLTDEASGEVAITFPTIRF